MSKFLTAEASSNYNCQHLQHPDFAQHVSSATETLGIYSIQAPHSRSIHQSHSLAFETSNT